MGSRRAELEKLGRALKDLEATRDRKVCVLYKLPYAVLSARYSGHVSHVMYVSCIIQRGRGCAAMLQHAVQCWTSHEAQACNILIVLHLTQ